MKLTYTVYVPLPGEGINEIYSLSIEGVPRGSEALSRALEKAFVFGRRLFGGSAIVKLTDVSLDWQETEK